MSKSRFCDPLDTGSLEGKIVFNYIGFQGDSLLFTIIAQLQTLNDVIIRKNIRAVINTVTDTQNARLYRHVKVSSSPDVWEDQPLYYIDFINGEWRADNLTVIDETDEVDTIDCYFTIVAPNTQVGLSDVLNINISGIVDTADATPIIITTDIEGPVTRGDTFTLAINAPAVNIDVALISSCILDRVYKDGEVFNYISAADIDEYGDASFTLSIEEGYGRNETAIIQLTSRNDPTNIAYSAPFVLTGLARLRFKDDVIISQSLYLGYVFDLSVSETLTDATDITLTIQALINGILDNDYNDNYKITIRDSEDNLITFNYIDPTYSMNMTDYAFIKLVNGEWSGVINLSIANASNTPCKIILEQCNGTIKSTGSLALT